MPDSSKPIREIALDALPRFRVDPQTKQPLTTHGFKDASTGHTEPIAPQRWGIPTGRATGVFVLDVDCYKPAGAEWLATQEAVVADVPYATTRNGGRHYYFRWESDEQVNGKVCPGVDLRGEGGYVVFYGFWPTDPTKLPAMPPTWWRQVPRPPGRTWAPADYGDVDWAGLLEPHGWSRNGQFWVHPDSTNRRTATITTHGNLYMHGTTCDPFESGSSYTPFRAFELLNPGVKNPYARFDPDAVPEDPGVGEEVWSILMAEDTVLPPPIPNGNGNGHHHIRWTAAELLGERFAEPRWVVPDLLPEGLSMLAGRPKRGKSWLSLQLAVALTAGGMFLGYRLEAATALVFALEDSPRRIQKRLRDLRCTGGELHVEFEVPPLTKGGIEYVTKTIERVDPALVVIDTLARTLKGSTDQNAVGEMSDILGPLQHMALQRRIALVVIDHLGKANTNDITSDILGSTAKGAVGDTLWGLYRKPGESKATLQVVGRDVEGTELVIQFQPVPLGWQLLGNAAEVQLSEAETEYVQVLDELGEADAGAVGEELFISREAAGKMLRRLQATGKVEARRVVKGGKNRVVFRLPSDDNPDAGSTKTVVPPVPAVPQGDSGWWADH